MAGSRVDSALHGVPMADILVCLQIDATELSRDLERIDLGELSTPTVSAVRFLIDGKPGSRSSASSPAGRTSIGAGREEARNFLTALADFLKERPSHY